MRADWLSKKKGRMWYPGTWIRSRTWCFLKAIPTLLASANVLKHQFTFSFKKGEILPILTDIWSQFKARNAMIKPNRGMNSKGGKVGLPATWLRKETGSRSRISVMFSHESQWTYSNNFNSPCSHLNKHCQSSPRKTVSYQDVQIQVYQGRPLSVTKIFKSLNKYNRHKKSSKASN